MMYEDYDMNDASNKSTLLFWILHCKLIRVMTGEKFTDALSLGNNNQGKFDQQ